MEKLAIIGTGIAGMGCGHHLHNQYEITFFEKNKYVGGHTNTVVIHENDTPVYIDTGFMVFNFQTYPHLRKLFDEIKAPIKKTDMSFSVQHVPSGLEYCGSGMKGLFAQKRNLLNISYIKMLLEISRFNKESIKILDDPQYLNYSLRDYIRKFRFSDDMLWKYLVPMSSAVWSTPMEQMLDFPAVTLIRFFKNHGFLGLNTQHQWYTIQDGSQAYREILIKPFKSKIRINQEVIRVKKEQDKVVLTKLDGQEERFDKVIFATHADQALQLLLHPSADERRLLSAFRYQKNTAVLHTDTSVMPKVKSAWSSWNYKIEELNGRKIPTTIYWMNNLQHVSKNENYFVSINPIPTSIDQKKVLKVIEYEHPLFDGAAIKAQEELHLLNKDGPLYYCGSYFKYGFHEDAYASAVNVCEKIRSVNVNEMVH